MSAVVEIFKGNKKILWGIKIIFCVGILIFFAKSLFFDGLTPYYSWRDDNVQNIFPAKQAISLSGEREVSQRFTARGNLLNNISIYFGDCAGETITAAITDQTGKTIAEIVFSTTDYTADSWGKIGLRSTKLKRGEEYIFSLRSDAGLKAFYINPGDSPAIFGNCYTPQNQIDGALVSGFQFTYQYLTLGSIAEILVKVMIFALLGGGIMCFYSTAGRFISSSISEWGKEVRTFLRRFLFCPGCISI